MEHMEALLLIVGIWIIVESVQRIILSQKVVALCICVSFSNKK